MKLTTFIKSYKIALANINDKVADWKDVYVVSILFPEKDEDVLQFIFSNGYNMQPGDIGISATINISRVDEIKGGLNTIEEMTMQVLDKDVLARKYINHGEKINEAGRMMVLLEALLQRLKVVESETWEHPDVKSVLFDFDKDIAEFEIDNKTVYTNGCIVMFG